MDEVDLGRVAVEMEILDFDLDKFAHPRAAQKQHPDHQTVPAASAVGRLDQVLDLESIETVDAAAASPGGCEGLADDGRARRRTWSGRSRAHACAIVAPCRG
jgi:hypothetical protein